MLPLLYFKGKPVTPSSFFSKNVYGLVEMNMPLTRGDFGPASEVRTDICVGKYGNYARVWQNFELITPMDNEDRNTFRGLCDYQRNHGEKIILEMGRRQEVDMRGIRKEKQKEKAGTALASIMSGFDGEAMLAAKIEKINLETLESISKDRAHNIQKAVVYLRTPSSFQWADDEKIQELNRKIQDLSKKKEALWKKVDALQIQEMSNYIKKKVPEPIKSAALKALEEKGLLDDSPFGRRF